MRRRLRHLADLLRQLVGLARAHRSWWILPLVLLLALAALIIAAGKTAAPLLYPVF